MDLKLNISKNGLSTTEEVINEEYTLRYGHVFRGKSAYEYAIESGLFSGTEEEFAAYLGNIKDETNAAKKAAASARDAAVLAGISTQSADDAAREALTEADNAKKAAASARDAAERANKAAENAELSIIEIDTVLSEASNNAIANSAVARELKKKVGATEVSSTEPTADFPQVLHTAQSLTEEQKSVARRNIYAMANTPSGDPMHSWYESLGAVWNATTGYWEFLGVNDMTNEDMLEEAILGNSRIYPTANLMSYTATARVIFGQKNMLLDASWSAVKADNLVTNNRYVEVIEFTTQTEAVWVSGFTWACAYCVKLREIRNILNVSLANIYNAFDGCVSLEKVKLQGVKKDVSFADSPLSVESATYTIANADASASFTITFRADRQAIFEANSDFITAKNAKPNITILYQ